MLRMMRLAVDKKVLKLKIGNDITTNIFIIVIKNCIKFLFYLFINYILVLLILGKMIINKLLMNYFCDNNILSCKNISTLKNL